MTNWKEYKLGDIAELRSEKFTPNEITSYPYIGLEHIEPKSLRLNGIGTSNDVSSQKSVFYPNDTLYGKLRPYFQKVYSPCFKGVCSTDIFVVKPKKRIHSKFLFYILASDEFTNLANSGSTGTRMPRADWKHLSTTIWNLPDLPTQTTIAEILSSLDDKIELNNKINQELENLAKTLFKQWFIDFEFPFDFAQGKPNENGNPYKSSGGEMVDSELGEIPKGWYVSTIEEITEVVTKGTTPTTIGGKFTESGINFIKVESLTEQGAFIKSKFGFIDEDTNQLLKRSIIKEGDVLFSIAGTIGRVAVVTKDILPANTNQAIAIIRPNNVDSNFLKLLMQSALIQNDTKSNVVQAVQANLSLGVIKATKFIKPSSEILNLFQSYLKEVFEQVNLFTEEVQELTNLRDIILPKLISGELEVSEAFTQTTI
jgi:type I restriction enzyme, S subunit